MCQAYLSFFQFQLGHCTCLSLVSVSGEPGSERECLGIPSRLGVCLVMVYEIMYLLCLSNDSLSCWVEYFNM
jgi:hypothetical protein